VVGDGAALGGADGGTLAGGGVTATWVGGVDPVQPVAENTIRVAAHSVPTVDRRI
jgi:hypothetical protein